MHFFFDFFLKCVPIIAKMRYLCGGFPETMARPDGGMVDTRDLKSLGLYGCAGSSPAWGTKTESKFILVLRFCFSQRSSHPVAHPSVRVYAPLPFHRKPRFRLGHSQLRHSHPAICTASVHHPPHSPAPLFPLYILPFFSLFATFLNLFEGRSSTRTLPHASEV